MAGQELNYPVEGVLSLREGSLPPTEVVLNGGEYRTLTQVDGSFVFHDVSPGVYLLDVLSVDFFFSQVKCNLPKSLDTIQCLEYKYPGAPKQNIAYPIKLKAAAKKQYFDQRETVGLHTLFKHPMAFMFLLTAGMVLVMPKLMENMDPDELKKMQDQMGAAQDPAQMLKNLFGGGEEKAIE